MRRSKDGIIMRGIKKMGITCFRPEEGNHQDYFSLSFVVCMRAREKERGSINAVRRIYDILNQGGGKVESR